MSERPIFDSHRDYEDFRQEVSFERRFLRSTKSEKFLSAVLTSCTRRVLTMRKGQVLYRAQNGHAWRTDELGNECPTPFPTERMKPLDDRAHEGRVNPKRIPCLYVATTREAALSEMRLGISAQLSVARLETIGDLRVIDCTRKHGNLVGYFEPPIKERDEVVWATIDRAFGEPVIRAEDRADYAATQIIAELMRINGYDGVAFRSQFDENGFNVALFDLEAVHQTECHLYRAKGVRYEFDGPWDGYWNKL
jgi:RES domain